MKTVWSVGNIRQAALGGAENLESVIRTITQERDKAETEVLVLERELATKESRLSELKGQSRDKGMRDHLKEVLENFDEQDDIRKRNEVSSSLSSPVPLFIRATNLSFGFGRISAGSADSLGIKKALPFIQRKGLIF